MKGYLTEDFLLRSETARELYHRYAAQQPIFDYHCHLPPALIAGDHRFRNLYDIWLGSDHYKWRAMRSNGVDERFCTGDAPDYDKFLAFARTVPYTLRNPLHHWTHLEAKRYFGFENLLDETSAPALWEKASALLGQPEYSARGLLAKSRVTVVCTTDDPVDDLTAHQQILQDESCATRVYPTFRPDKALTVHQPETFNAWVSRLEQISGIDCTSFSGFLDALKSRHDFFHEIGGRLSDHGLNYCPGQFAPTSDAAGIFDAARAGTAATLEQWERFAGHLMAYFGRLGAARGWTMQLHLGAQRNNNTRLFRALGPDTGFDSIGDWPQAANVARFLDVLDQDNMLPRTVLYNLNPADNYVFGTMVGNFQDGSIPGKIQFGSGWWFLDQKEGMEWHINALSSLGLLSRFVGMLTDSRSFLSYPRHEYFRRILCHLLGSDVENGEAPNDLEYLGTIVRGICYDNALAYFGLEPGEVKAP